MRLAVPRRPGPLTSLIFALSLSAPAAATSPRCEPLRTREWAAACDTEEGRARIRRLLGECRNWRSLSGIDTVEEACDVLRIGEDADPCERARRQALAFALNVASGRLSLDCCVSHEGRTVRLRDLRDERDEDCHARRRCSEARSFFSSVNDGSALVACEGGGTGGDCCRPRSKGFWARQCRGEHPAYSREEFSRLRGKVDRRLGDRCGGTCEALDNANFGTARGRALAQYAALLLNLESGRLEGCDSAEREIRAVEALLDRSDWEAAKDRAEAVNLGRSVTRCGDDDEGGDDGDPDHDHDGDGCDHPSHRGHGKGHEKHDHDKGRGPKDAGPPGKGKGKGKG